MEPRIQARPHNQLMAHRPL